jgi:hypothetical protein
MTTLAWDGRIFAADKRATMGGLIRTTSKIHKLTRPYVCLAGFTGDADVGQAMLDWFADGAKPQDFPRIAERDTGPSRLSVIMESGEIWMYERTPSPFKLDKGQHYSCGSGRDFALMAMRLGANAVEAVALTSEFDTGTGNGVDYASFVPVDPFPSRPPADQTNVMIPAGPIEPPPMRPEPMNETPLILPIEP